MPSALIGRPGDDVEAVVSMLLCRRHIRAARRRAGQGDRGVDVMVPTDEGRLDIYQVKKFDRPLTASQWTKIRESYETLVRACAEGRLAVRNWHLALPLDQSEADEAKFAEMTADTPFERCEWNGLAWLDALAAEFPDVVDYYLHDGRARLEEAHRDLMRVLDTRDAVGEPGEAAAASDGLGALYRSLNRHDPHYRYEFAVGDVANRDAYVPHEPPGTLVATAQVSSGETCVTWHVHARCDESLRERPVPVGLRFHVAESPDLREALRMFVEYGQPFEGPAGVSVDLPGGLGVDHGSGNVRIGPTADATARSYVLRMRTVGRRDVQSTSVRLAMRAPTVGSVGARLSGEHEGGAFAFEGLHSFEPATMRVRFRPLDLSGKAVSSVIDGVEFLAALPGSAIEVAGEHGPFMSFGDGTLDAAASSNATVWELEALRALHVVQQHTTTVLLAPDFEKVTVGEVREWQRIAAILAGETVVDARLGTLTTELVEAPEQPLDGDQMFTFTTDLVATVGGQAVALGQQLLHVAGATVRTDPVQPTRLSVTPLSGEKWMRRLGASQH